MVGEFSITIYRYATNGHLAINWLLDEGIKTDKLMFFTDMQMWDSRGDGGYLEKSWKRYKQFNPDAHLYLFDLNGYGHSPVRLLGDDVTLIAGWSDKIFDVLNAVENGEDTLSQIYKVEI